MDGTERMSYQFRPRGAARIIQLGNSPAPSASLVRGHGSGSRAPIVIGASNAPTSA